MILLFLSFFLNYSFSLSISCLSCYIYSLSFWELYPLTPVLTCLSMILLSLFSLATCSALYLSNSYLYFYRAILYSSFSAYASTILSLSLFLNKAYFYFSLSVSTTLPFPYLDNIKSNCCRVTKTPSTTSIVSSV